MYSLWDPVAGQYNDFPYPPYLAEVLYTGLQITTSHQDRAKERKHYVHHSDCLRGECSLVQVGGGQEGRVMEHIGSTMALSQKCELNVQVAGAGVVDYILAMDPAVINHHLFQGQQVRDTRRRSWSKQ